MYEKICEIILDYVDEPEGGLTPETRFIDDLAMNSLDIMTMAGQIEDEFDLTIETSDLNGIVTIRDLVDYLKSRS